MKTLSLLMSIAIFSATAAFPQQPVGNYDLVIINARIIDGAGNPWFRGSVAIKDGRIARVGRFDRAAAKFVIDGKNQIGAPGFIGVHAHTEDGFSHPSAEN